MYAWASLTASPSWASTSTTPAGSKAPCQPLQAGLDFADLGGIVGTDGRDTAAASALTSQRGGLCTCREPAVH
jgi:hypothetical protein